MRRLVRAIAVVLIVILASAAAAIPALRAAALQRVGRTLTDADMPAAAAADLLTMDVESGLAGALRVADLYREQPATVGVMVTRPTAIDAVLRQRGVAIPHVVRDALTQLGVPAKAIVEIPGGEGGTTETAGALADWSRAHRGKRVTVVVGPSHGRRYRRALLRAWPNGEPPPRVVVTPYALFKSDDWWQSRTTLREGLVELEKLLLDYVAHPF